ncbi:hypothetical protein COU54_00675 [Candidatus Pacearchaeota archaeon CG10_big_fil_rev_8_21_14_0_10_31_24]|nr:MAG: hypothetical protein COU54_00675 [Candidatus Pacearchaeota archaeon CG10_big_fil_rev_8_21_14_0_10_31_24]
MIYEPSDDSYLLASKIKDYSKNKLVLDIGSGSGIQALEALKDKAKLVVATDLDAESLEHLNSLTNAHQNLKIIKSNLFENISEKFDLITFNPPYLPLDKREDKESQLITTGGKTGDEIVLKFLEQASQHLNQDGKILLLLSSLTPKSKIKTLLHKLNLKSKIIARQGLFMEQLEVWEISN